MNRRYCKNNNFISFCFLFIAIFLPSTIFAAWDGTLYDQGETLNPECSPTEEHCTVSIPEPGNLSSQDGVTYIGTLSDTISSPSSVNIGINVEGDGFPVPLLWHPVTHVYRVYSYKNVGNGRVYSETYTEKQKVIKHDDVDNQYTVVVDWDGVEGADGYRVFVGTPSSNDDNEFGGVAFHAYQDVTGTELIDINNAESWNEGTEVFPKGIPFAVNEALGTVGIGMSPSSSYALSVSGDTLTKGGIFFSSPVDTGAIHYGPNGLYGQAQKWTPNPDGHNSGIWIEGSSDDEGGGFYADGDMAAIWSAGDVDLLRVYDEDNLATNRASFILDHDGNLRSDVGLVGVDDSMSVGGVLSVGILNKLYTDEDRLGVQNKSMLNIVQSSNVATEQISYGDMEVNNWPWYYSNSWSIHDGQAHFSLVEGDASRIIRQVFDNNNLNKMIEGDVYDVSMNVGGDSGSLRVCLGLQDSGNGCSSVSAGSGNNSISLAWHPDGKENDNYENNIITIKASPDFNGTIDDVSVMTRPKTGLSFLSANAPVWANLGLDASNDAVGLKIGVGNPGGEHFASLFLEGDVNTNYGYKLPSLETVDGGVDTFCMKNLGNCGDSSWNIDESGINFITGNVGMGTTSTSSVKLLVDGEDVLTPGNKFSNLGSYSFGYSNSIAISGHIVIATNNDGSVGTFDVSDPTNIVQLDTFGADNVIYKLEVSGHYAYISEEQLVEIVDISDPENLTLAGSWSEPNWVQNTAVSGNYAYSVVGQEGLHIVDISDPTNPVSVSHVTQVDFGSGLTNFFLTSIVVSGDYAYVSNEYDKGLIVFNISDKNNPVVAGYYLNNEVDIRSKMIISGNYLYTVNDDNDKSFVIFDISNPTEPILAGYKNIGSYRVKGEVKISGNYAYVADGEPDSLYIFDISDPTDPVQVDYYESENNSYGIVFDSHGNAFVANGNGGILALSTGATETLALKTVAGNTLFSGFDAENMRYVNFGTSTGENGYGIRNNNGTMQFKNVDGEWTNFGTGWNSDSNGIHSVSAHVGIGTNSSPQAGLSVLAGGAGIGFSEIANYNTDRWSYDVVVSGDYAYAGDGSTFDVVDVSDPEHGEIIGSYDVGNQIHAVRVYGDYAYVGAGTNFYVINISNPKSPTQVYSNTMSGQIKDIQIENEKMYMIDSNYHISVFDISGDNAEAPTLFTYPYDTNGAGEPMRLAVSGNRAYITDDSNNLEIWDISDPLEMENIANYNYSDDSDWFSGGVAARGNYVYTTRDTDDGKSFVILDSTNPSNLRVLGSVDIGNWRWNTRVTLSGDIAYVADGDEDSIYAINISYPKNPILVGHGETEGHSYGVAVHGNDLIVADGDVGLIALHAPLNYSALFNGGNLGIGTSDPEFNLDVGAVKATAKLSIINATGTNPTDGDGFMLVDNGGAQRYYEFDDNGYTIYGYPIIIVDGDSNPLTVSQIINNTVKAINQDGVFFASRDGYDIIIEQLVAGGTGNRWNQVWSPSDNQFTHHPAHPSANFILTDFTGGANGDINFGGNLYQHGELFTGSQWTDFDGGIIYNNGDVSIGDGAFYYDSQTGETSIDNLSLGALTFPEDAGVVSWIDMPISGNATNGTIESYTASIGGIDILTIHGAMNGGSLENTGVRLDNLPTSTGEQTSFLCLDANNEIVVGSGSDCDVSSMRFKDNINSLSDDSGLAELMKLNPVSFFYKPEFNGALQTNPNYNSEQVGFIAEEVQAIDPRLITLESDGVTPHGVRYEKITAILVKAVKEIGKWVDEFTTKKLCVGDTCVTEAEFKEILKSAGVNSVPKNFATGTESRIETANPTTANLSGSDNSVLATSTEDLVQIESNTGTSSSSQEETSIDATSSQTTNTNEIQDVSSTEPTNPVQIEEDVVNSQNDSQPTSPETNTQ